MSEIKNIIDSEIIIKTCKGCQVSKNIKEFWVRNANKDGRDDFCITCAREKDRLHDKNKKRKLVVYGLYHPETDELRYIGITDDLTRRYNRHLSGKELQEKTHKNNWVKSLLSQNIKPIVKIIEECKTYDELKEREIYYIAHYRELKYRLTNASDGGDGCLGYKHPPETIEKMKEIQKNRVWSPESKASQAKKISIAHTGKKYSHEVKLKVSRAGLNRIVSDDAKKKISDSKLGSKNPMYGKNIPKTQISFNQAQEIRQLWLSNNFTFVDIAEMFNCCYSVISNIVKNKTHTKEKKYLSNEQMLKIKKLYEEENISIENLAIMFEVNRESLRKSLRKISNYRIRRKSASKT